MSKQLLIQAHELHRQQLIASFNAVVGQLTYADAGKSVQLEQERDILFQKIQSIEKEQDKLRQEESKQSIQDLINLLTSNWETIASQVVLAYQRTLRQKQVIAQDLSRPEAIVRDLLSRAGDGMPYTWLQRFVGYLLMMELPLSLLVSLKEWAEIETNIPDLANLQQAIAAESIEQEAKKSCLIIRIRKSHLDSTKKGSDRYFIDAWFVEDLNNYRDTLIGAQPVRLLETVEDVDQQPDRVVPPGQTYTKDEIEPTVRQLRRRCLDLYQAERPLIQVFLPLELMNLDIDGWALQEGSARGRFGHRHEIVLRAGDRLDAREYDLKQEWQSKWKLVEGKFLEIAGCVFRDGIPDNVDALYGMGQLPEVLGMKLTQALSELPETIVNELFQTLVLESAIPLAFWLRQAASGVDCCSELSTVLNGCRCLKDLPDTLRRTRLEVLNCDQAMRDRHIGNHLSLLWDDPRLLPPVPNAA